MVDAVHDICQVPEGELPLRGQLDAAWAPYARGWWSMRASPICWCR